jgi:tetratricopeptide (TPR) repeat protein
MPEPVLTPFCFALALGFAGKLLGFGATAAGLPVGIGEVVGGAGSDAVRSILKNLLHLAGDSTLDPVTNLPRNHDLQRASRDALREAVLVGILELSGRLDPQKPWLPAILDHIRDGKFLEVPLIEARHDPQREWLEAFRLAVTSARFNQWHDSLKLDEEEVRRCFQGDQCRLAELLAPRLLAWARKEVQVGQEPPGFEPLVTHGWEISTGSGRITLEQAYCLFFREHLKHRPEVFRIYVADTLGELLKRQGNAITKTDFAAFEQWIEPQLGELKSLLADIAVQLHDVADAQKELSGQQGQILVALVAIQTEVRRGNTEASRQFAVLSEWLRQAHAEQLAAHRQTHASLGRAHDKLDTLVERVTPNFRPPFDRLPSIRAGQLVGRDALLRELVGRLRRREDACVAGAPGFGKTALAVTALREVIGESDDDLARSPFPDGLVFLELYQLKADPERVWTRLADAFAPGLHSTLLPRHRAARACVNRRALVVVEGAEEAGDGAALQDILSVLGTQVRRLILTRNAAQDFTGRPLRVDRELAHDDALRLLRLLSPQRGTDVQLEEILGLLGGSPLALTHAGLQLANPEDSPTRFLQELRAAPLDKVCEPGNEKHPLRWLYGRSWRLVSEGARRVMAGCGNLAYGPFDAGAAEACLLEVKPETGHSDRARAALRELVRHGILSPPDSGERWVLSHALAYRYAGLRADPALRVPLARWVVAEFSRGLEQFKSSQNPRPVADLLTHASGLLAVGVDGSCDVAVALEKLVDAMPRPGETVLLCPHLATITGELHRSVVVAVDAGRVDLQRQRAKFAGTLSNWLRELGRRAEAVAPAQEAVELYRALAQHDPGALLNLARSLNIMAGTLGDLGRRVEALRLVQEAVDLCRVLARHDPDTFNPDFAMLLNNLAGWLSELGRRAEALGPAQEAVELHRLLAGLNPDIFKPALASSLNNLATFLSDLGRRAETLGPAQEAVELHRELAGQNPDAYIPALARSLNNLANRLSEVGRRAEALASAQEAVALRRALVRQNPDAYTPALARSLNNLAIRLSDLGRRGEALAPAQEAVDLYRALAWQNPDAYTPDLAMSLGIMGKVQEANGQPEAALACIREGVERLTHAFQQLPAAFSPLAQFLHEGYLRVLATTGREPNFAGAEAFLVPVAEGLQALAAQKPPETAAGE